MIETLTIDRLAHRGEGIANVDGCAVFVPYALPGEAVEVEIVPGHPDRRRLIRVLEPSPDRIPAFCPHFAACGGCAIQHLPDEIYRAWKMETLREVLRNGGIDAPLAEMIDAHGEGRRRAVFHARRGTHDVLNVGFAALSAHQIVPIDHCPILAPGMSGAVNAAWALAEAAQSSQKPTDIHVTATEAGLDIDLRGTGPLNPEQNAILARLASQHRIARLTRHGELIVQRDVPVVTMGTARVAIPPGAFLQATALGEETLAARVLDHCPKAKHVADLFCGVGPFALRLAQFARVEAFDSEKPSIDALARAAKATSGTKPVKAEARDLFRRPLYPPELADFDAVVFDPPRQGAQAQATQLAKSRVPLVVAVSCNPATFVRDARLLLDGGYRITDVHPVDQFKYTSHVELVARFER